MSLAWLWEQLSPESKSLVEKTIQAFADPQTDRGRLIELANSQDIQTLEKQYLPQKPQPDDIQRLKGRALIASVGFRPMPVILSALLLEPTKLYLLHSQESRRFAEQVRDDEFIQNLGLDPVKDILLREISLTDAPQNYGVLQEIVAENPDTEFVVDVSGGVKVMGVSLASAAFWLRLPVVYMLGKEVKGIIEPFSEELTLLKNPFVHFGSPDFRSIANLFALGEYDAAMNVCRNLQETIGDVSLLGKLDILLEFIELYRDWDLFLHSQAEDTPQRKLGTRLRVIRGKMRRLGLVIADEDALDANQAFLDALEKSWQLNKRNNSEPYRLVDIFAAAQRRAAVGKYDDAIARCYRCMEMSASIALIDQCALKDTKEPDLNFFIVHLGSEAKLQEAFRKKAGYALNPGGGLGLKDQMTLLTLSPDKKHQSMGNIYFGMEKGNLMELRNRSTLAHGTIPVTREEYQRFEGKTRQIIDFLFEKGEFDRLLAMAKHPSLQLT